MTKTVDGEKGEGMTFASPNQAMLAYDYELVSLRAKINVLGSTKEKYSRFEGKPFETSVGRLFFNTVLPVDLPYINDEMTQKRISAFVDELIYKYGIDATPKTLDKIKDFGYKYITKSGITWGIDNVPVPKEKKEIIEKGRKKEEEVISQWSDGLLSQEEKYRKVIEI